MTGQTFGHLTVVDTAEPKRRSRGRLRHRVVVACDCGSPQRIVEVDNLRRGNTTSCGCTRKAARPARRSEVVAYRSMHSRLRRWRGPASDFVCVDCKTKQAREWSYDRTGIEEMTEDVNGVTIRYSLDLDSYSPRCSTCHHAHDRGERKTCARGHDFDDCYRKADGSRASCRPCRREKYRDAHPRKEPS